MLSYFYFLILCSKKKIEVGTECNAEEESEISEHFGDHDDLRTQIAVHGEDTRQSDEIEDEGDHIEPMGYVQQI